MYNTLNIALSGAFLNVSLTPALTRTLTQAECPAPMEQASRFSRTEGGSGRWEIGRINKTDRRHIASLLLRRELCPMRFNSLQILDV